MIMSGTAVGEEHFVRYQNAAVPSRPGGPGRCVRRVANGRDHGPYDKPVPFADKLDNPRKIYAKYAKIISDG